MNKSKIITIIIIILSASLISEARAQGPYFDIYVRDKNLLNTQEQFTNALPQVASRITQEQILEAERLAKLAQEEALRKQITTKVANDTRKDFTSIYVAAGERFGVDWRVLAAVHSVETGQRGDTQVRSYAGAQGPMQFIPSTFRAYAVDGDGDGVKNINDVDDAIFTAANYIGANSRTGGGIDNALYRYNHSWSYVNKVKQIAGI
ncbi:lytic transglycosylase domain-containing protein [bacterium]|nr:lytic transglycosylase domain-containing protein [bacterium]